jgi:hypothetical protein
LILSCVKSVKRREKKKSKLSTAGFCLRYVVTRDLWILCSLPPTSLKTLPLNGFLSAHPSNPNTKQKQITQQRLSSSALACPDRQLLPSYEGHILGFFPSILLLLRFQRQRRCSSTLLCSLLCSEFGLGQACSPPQSWKAVKRHDDGDTFTLL